MRWNPSRAEPATAPAPPGRCTRAEVIEFDGRAEPQELGHQAISISAARVRATSRTRTRDAGTCRTAEQYRSVQPSGSVPSRPVPSRPVHSRPAELRPAEVLELALIHAFINVESVSKTAGPQCRVRSRVESCRVESCRAQCCVSVRLRLNTIQSNSSRVQSDRCSSPAGC